TVEVLEVGDHDLVPKAARLQVVHHVFVGYREFAGEIRLDVQVLILRLDAGGDADDVGNGRGRRDGDAVRVAHAMLTDTGAQGIPIHDRGAIDVDMAATLLCEQVERVLRQDAAIPQAATERRIAAALFC